MTQAQVQVVNFVDKLRKETSKFNLEFKYDPAKKQYVFLIQSRAAGKHFAKHYSYQLLGNDGELLSIKPITKDVAQYIMDHFEERGDTASFSIFMTDLAVNTYTNRKVKNIEPELLRHTLTSNEQSFTATGDKLYYHWPIFQKYKETGHGSIIRATLTLHQVCSSHCQYCSTIARNKKDSITLEEAKDFVKALYYDQAEFNRTRFSKYNELYKSQTGADIRLRGLILSGGGQPNLWPHFEEFVNWLATLDLDVGLITNGFPTKINDDIYRKFKWIRISITPEDASPHYVDKKFNLQYIPNSIKNSNEITVGYSYVYGAWTSDDILSRIDLSIEENGFSYCRMLTDCNLPRSDQLMSHNNLAERLFRLGFIDEKGNPVKKLFHQLKYHGTPDEGNELWTDGQCQLQIYNVFWDTTGHEENGVSYCYACDSITVLAEEVEGQFSLASERKFNSEKWGLVTNDMVKLLYETPVKPYFDPRSNCSACLFMKNNKTVKELTHLKEYTSIRLGAAISHINFP
jgi:organic radical activating enzyme